MTLLVTLTYSLDVLFPQGSLFLFTLTLSHSLHPSASMHSRGTRTHAQADEASEVILGYKRALALARCSNLESKQVSLVIKLSSRAISWPNPHLLINRLHFAELHPPVAAARIISSKVTQARHHHATLLEPLTHHRRSGDLRCPTGDMCAYKHLQHRFRVYGLGLQNQFLCILTLNRIHSNTLSLQDLEFQPYPRLLWCHSNVNFLATSLQLSAFLASHFYNFTASRFAFHFYNFTHSYNFTGLSKYLV